MSLNLITRLLKQWTSKKWEFPQESHAGKKERHHTEGGNLSPRKSFHTVLTNCQAALQDEAEAQTMNDGPMVGGITPWLGLHTCAILGPLFKH